MFYTVSILLRKISNFILNIFIARLVSVQDFGEYSQFTIFATYILLITEFGYNEYILVKSKKENNLDFLLSNFVFISVLTITVMVFILLLFNQPLLLFLILFKVYLDVYFSKLILSYYQFEQKFKIYSSLNIFYSISIFIFVFFLQYLNLSIENIVLLIDLLLLMFTITLTIKSNTDINLISMKKLAPYIDKGFFYYAMSSITVPIYMLMPIFIMTFFISKENTAIFYLAYTISSVMVLISISINQQYLPKLIHDKKKFFYEHIKLPILLLVGFNIFVFSIFYFYGEFVLAIILNKPEYIESNKYILLLMISNIFQSASGLIALYLITNNLMKEKLFIHIELIAISFIFSILMTYYYGIIGVAWSYILLYIYTFFRYLFFILRQKEKHYYGK